MRALKVDGIIRADRTLEAQLPEDVEAGPAEIIVLLPERPPVANTDTSLLDFLASLPPGKRSKEEIDKERASLWESQ